jgi:guanylate kinase
VVDQAGSYGYQLNRIIDLLKVAVDDGTLKGKNEREKQVIAKFLTLAKNADQAAKEFKGEATQESVHKLIEDIRRLQHSDRKLYESLVDELRGAFSK